MILILVISLLVMPGISRKADNTSSALYGITLNDLTKDNVDEITEALGDMGVRPTVRVVMNPGQGAEEYRPLLEKIHKKADIMLCPCDSSYMKQYKTTAEYQARFADCISLLWDDVDIWEIGNEVNGEGWLGVDAQAVSERIYAVWAQIQERGGITELTPYAFAPGDQSVTMEDWMKKYIPEDMRAGLDYVLVSYYDDDNEGRHEDWDVMFRKLEALFPNAHVGFGECGFPQPHVADSAFKAQVKAYYQMPRLSERYVGGYFWWYWQQDCLPKENSGFSWIAGGCDWMKKNY